MQTYQENKGGNIDTSELATVHVGSNSDLESYILAGKYPLADYPLGTVHVDTDNESLGIYFRFGEFDWRKVATNTQNYRNFAFKSDLLPMGNIFNANTFINKYFGDITDTTHFRILDVLGFENYLKENRLNNCLRLSPYVCDENKMYLFKGSEKIEMSFSRSTSKSSINQLGEIIEIAPNVADIQLDTDNKPFVKLEPQSTNLIPYSEDFSQSVWSKNGCSVISGQLSPKSDTSAFKLIDTSVNETHFIRAGIFATSGVGTNVTYSIFLKANELSKIGFVDGWTNVTYASVDLLNESILTSVSVDVQIKNIGDFKRISFTYTTANANTIPDVFLLDSNYTTQNPSSYSYLGNGNGLTIAHAQFEEQLYATSPIKTSGTIETRTADSASKSGLSNYINSQEGVLYVESSALVELQTTTRNLTISDGTTSNRLYLYYTTLGEFGFAAIVGNALQCNIKYNGIITNNSKIALKYKLNDYALWLDGVEVGTDSSASVLSNGTLNTLSSSLDGNKFYGKVKDLRVYDTVLTDQELTDLTTI